MDFKQLPAHVTPSDSITDVSVSIQKIGKKTIKDVPVQLIGIFERGAFRLNPGSVSVEITGGERILDSISLDNINLFVEYNRFQIEDVDSLAPTVKLQLGNEVNREMSIKAIQVFPDKVSLQKIKSEPVAPADSLGEDAEEKLE